MHWRGRGGRGRGVGARGEKKGDVGGEDQRLAREKRVGGRGGRSSPSHFTSKERYAGARNKLGRELGGRGGGVSADPARAVHVQSPVHGVHTWPKVLV